MLYGDYNRFSFFILATNVRQINECEFCFECECDARVCIGNHMISSAIWDKSAPVNFSKTNKIARARRASAICSL